MLLLEESGSKSDDEPAAMVLPTPTVVDHPPSPPLGPHISPRGSHQQNRGSRGRGSRNNNNFRNGNHRGRNRSVGRTTNQYPWPSSFGQWGHNPWITASQWSTYPPPPPPCPYPTTTPKPHAGLLGPAPNSSPHALLTQDIPPLPLEKHFQLFNFSRTIPVGIWTRVPHHT